MTTFTYGSHTLVLRNPDFGNKDSVESRRINRKTRGGDLIVMRDPIWPTTEILDMTFSYLKEKQVNAIVEFLKMSLGQQIGLTDYEGRTWTGIIISPTEAITTQGQDNVQVTIQFQGVLSA